MFVSCKTRKGYSKHFHNAFHLIKSSAVTHLPSSFLIHSFLPGLLVKGPDSSPFHAYIAVQRSMRDTQAGKRHLASEIEELQQKVECGTWQQAGLHSQLKVSLLISLVMVAHHLLQGNAKCAWHTHTD